MWCSCICMLREFIREKCFSFYIWSWYIWSSYPMFPLWERNYPGRIGCAGCGSSMKWRSVKYCLCMQGEVSFIIFKTLSADCMIFNLSMTKPTSGILSSEFPGFSYGAPCYVGVFIHSSFNVHIILDRNIVCFFLFFTLNDTGVVSISLWTGYPSFRYTSSFLSWNPWFWCSLWVLFSGNHYLE